VKKINVFVISLRRFCIRSICLIGLFGNDLWNFSSTNLYSSVSGCRIWRERLYSDDWSQCLGTEKIPPNAGAVGAFYFIFQIIK